jgi:hypothetical protein
LAGVQAEEKPVRFLLDFRPGSFLISPDIDGFTVRNAGDTYRETLVGGGSWTPSVNAGVGINFQIMDLNITAGPGYLWNTAFHGGFWQADLSTMFKLAEGHFRIGPHIGIVGLGNATWDSIDTSGIGGSEPQIDLQGNSGLKMGLSMQAGGDRVAFMVNIDVVDIAYDISTSGGWVAQDDDENPLNELDMSGGIIDLGLIIRF